MCARYITIIGVCRGAKALLVAQQVLQHSDMRELELFSLMASPSRKQLKIRLDKVHPATASLPQYNLTYHTAVNDHERNNESYD